MIIACYNVYNEAAYLEESILSLRDKVDGIVIVDGAYKKFPHKSPESTDGTIEIARKYADVFIPCGRKRIGFTPWGLEWNKRRQVFGAIRRERLAPEPWKSEIEKRNEYLSGREGDVYLVVDGHEIWRGELDPTIVGNWRIKVKRAEGDASMEKMFRHYEGIHYAETHYKLWVDGKPLNLDVPEYPLGYFEHKDGYSEARNKARAEYYRIPHFDN